MKYRLASLLLLLFIIAAGVLWWGHRHPKPHTASGAKTTLPTATGNKTAPPGFNKQQYSLEDPTSLWVIANKKRPLNPLAYVPGDLTGVGNGQVVRAEAAQALTEVFAAAKTAGYNLVAESGYRSYQTQVSVYNREVQNFGQAKADTESARPGYSEHQTGWAVDIGLPGCYEDCFGTTAAAGWIAAHSYEYGFTLRYTSDKVAVTGYRSEPWHFRYVGKALAAQLHTANQAMEEFFGLPAVGAP